MSLRQYSLDCTIWALTFGVVYVVAVGLFDLSITLAAVIAILLASAVSAGRHVRA